MKYDEYQHVKLSENFWLKEWAVSKDYPDLAQLIEFSPAEIERIRMFTLLVLQPMRMALQTPIMITSGKRSPKLNELVGGSERSRHLFQHGQLAVDIKAPTLKDPSLPARWLEEDYSFNRKHYLRNFIFYPDEGRFIHLCAPEPGEETGKMFVKMGKNYIDISN